MFSQLEQAINFENQMYRKTCDYYYFFNYCMYYLRYILKNSTKFARSYFGNNQWFL